MQFSANVTVAHDSIVDQVFSNQVLLATEAVEDAKTVAGHITLIGNYRGHTLESGRGRKAAAAGETVVDLTSLKRVAIEDLPKLADQLEALYSSYQEKDVASMLEDLANQAIAAKG